MRLKSSGLVSRSIYTTGFRLSAADPAKYAHGPQKHSKWTRKGPFCEPQRYLGYTPECVRVQRARLEIGLFGTNVTNQIYPISISEDFAAFGFETTYYGPPRMYGVRLRYSFGE